MKPETLRQARRWDDVKSQYVSAGLCHHCASQAAWGHQGGFASIKPPCGGCKGLTMPASLVLKHGDRAVTWLI